MLEIFKYDKRNITIIREEFSDFKIDVYISSMFKKTSPSLGEGLEKFYNKNIKGLIPNGKNIFIFCFNNYQGLEKIINKLEEEGHSDIKQSDIYLYNNKGIYKI